MEDFGQKEQIEKSFAEMGIDIKLLKADQKMEDVDDFDFICYIAYGTKPLTRKERANNVKKRDFFQSIQETRELFWKYFLTSI